MYRAIITPKQARIYIDLPDDMVGKSVEVVADLARNEEVRNPQVDLEEAIRFYKNHSIDFRSIQKWDREDLHD